MSSKLPNPAPIGVLKPPASPAPPPKNGGVPRSSSFNRLLGTRVYLAGPMDRVADGGVVWRRDLTPWLNSRGIIVFDPCDKPIDLGVEDANSRRERGEAKNLGDFGRLADEMKLIRRVDLRMIDITDFVIAYVNTTVHMCGTYEEIVTANRQKKPILTWVEQGRLGCPDWLFGMLPTEHIFDSLDDIKAHLNEVATLPAPPSSTRWFFFDAQKLYNNQVVNQIRPTFQWV